MVAVTCTGILGRATCTDGNASGTGIAGATCTRQFPDSKKTPALPETPVTAREPCISETDPWAAPRGQAQAEAFWVERTTGEDPRLRREQVTRRCC
jgi:hypothetical protein